MSKKHPSKICRYGSKTGNKYGWVGGFFHIRLAFPAVTFFNKWGPGRGGRLTSDLDHFFCDLALFREKSTDLAKIHFLSVTRTETY